MSDPETMLAGLPQDEQDLLRPLVVTTGKFWYAAMILGLICCFGLVAYLRQLRYGLGTTGLNNPEYWGIYIIDFVFFIGISHAGTLISAILRISNAEWRRSITRSAEFITVLVISFGAVQPIIDLGRPDRALNIILHAQPLSPLLWDVTSIGLYFCSCTIYLYLPMIPDLAIIRDRKIKMPGFYRVLALGYNGSPRQKHLLEKTIGVLAVAVIPVAISVHTVIGWIFALTLRPMWHSTIFGPYFVMGAIYSGIAALLIAMAILRKVYRLENYFKDAHFNNMGILLLLMSCLWAYFTFAEYLTAFYGQEAAEMRTFWDKLSGRFAWPFWIMVLFCSLIPFCLMCRKKTRNAWGTTLASCFVVIGMWLERFNIVVPTSVNPRLDLYQPAHYAPSWVELGIMAGTFSGFILLYMIASKFFPMVSIWELREGKESVVELTHRVSDYLPETLPPVGVQPAGAAAPL
jgi:molybdopterin-containing oxidoreductase family membrane subunit